MNETEPRTVNVPLLRKAVEWAEAEAAKPPELCEWEQGIVRSVRPQAMGKADACGTCYCVAGFVASTQNDDYAAGRYVSGFDATQVAAEALGIPRWDGDDTAGSHLFADDNSIADVRRIAEDLAGERL